MVGPISASGKKSAKAEGVYDCGDGLPETSPINLGYEFTKHRDHCRPDSQPAESNGKIFFEDKSLWDRPLRSECSLLFVRPSEHSVSVTGLMDSRYLIGE